jgi:6-phospho-beta-glucosidase
MRIAIIGGAGVRTPLLVRGLVGSDLPIHEIALYDPDAPRLAIVSALARRFAGDAAIATCGTCDACVEGAEYVFTSIRVGGIEARARDEATSTAHGVVGQETVGPGGFAMAMRTVPHMVRYAGEVARRAPRAWIINFTNPVGIITQAVRAATGARIIGICDTPTELFEDIAHVLGVPSSECAFDYFGLNHLGWVREVLHRGEPQLHRLWNDPDALSRVYRAPLFSPAFLRELRLLPTEYLYYYYCAREAYERVAQAGRSRGAVVERLNADLFDALRAAARDSVDVYEQYVAARNAGYMQLESGSTDPRERPPRAALTGYDKIALQVVRAIHFNSGAIVPLNVANNGNISGLQPDDVVEVPCVVNANGALPMHVGAMPATVRDLVVQVKEYERLTVSAALAGDRALAVTALARNPLVSSTDLARRLVDTLMPA